MYLNLKTLVIIITFIDFGDYLRIKPSVCVTLNPNFFRRT